MSRTFNVLYNAIFNVTELPDASIAPGLDPTNLSRMFNAYNRTTLLNSVDAPAVTAFADLSFTLTAATKDVDLTAAPDPDNIAAITVDLTGKKLIGWVFKAASTNNAAGLTIQAHPTSNGYNLLGASGLLTLFPAEHAMKCLNTAGTARLPAVDATHKVIRIGGAIGDVINGLLLFS